MQDYSPGTAMKKTVLVCLPLSIIWGTAEIYRAYFLSYRYEFSVQDQLAHLSLYYLIAVVLGCMAGVVLGLILWVASLVLKNVRHFETSHIFSIVIIMYLYFYTLLWWHGTMDPMSGFFTSQGILATCIISILFSVLMVAGLNIIPVIFRPSWFSPVTVCALIILSVIVIGLAARFKTTVRYLTGRSSETAVILLSIDTLRADHLGCYGHPNVKTPFMDLLAKSGMQFTDCTSQIPGTNPNFATIMTSLYPHAHGVFFNGVPVPQELLTLPQVLSNNRFVTGAFIAASVLKSKVSGLKKGFDVYNEEYSLRDYGFNPFIMIPFFRNFSVRNAESVNNAAYPFLQACKFRKFFIWMHYYDPHNSYSPPPPYSKMYNPDYRGPVNGNTRNVNWFNDLSEKNQSHVEQLIHLYDGEISYTDANLERLYHFLKLNFGDREQKFLYVLTADHGEQLCDHIQEFGHGKVLYNPSLKVPLIVAGNRVAHNLLRTEKVETRDIAPSILQALKLSIPQQMTGNVIFTDSTQPVSKPVYAENGDKLVSMETEDWKCIYSLNDQRLELFSLTNDPAETRNVANTRNGIARNMRDMIMELLGPRKDFVPQQPVLPEKLLKELEDLGYITR